MRGPALIGVFVAPGAFHSGQERDAQRRPPSGAWKVAAMLCSEFELKLSDNHEGIIELPADAARRCALRAVGRHRRSDD